MKKVLVILAVVSITLGMATEKVHAQYAKGGSIGFALTGGFASGGGFGGVITFSVPKVPLMFGVNGGIWGSGFNVNLSGDWWALNPQLGTLGSAPVYLYFGPGIYLGLNVDNKDLGFNLGIRAPLGFTFLVDKSKKWEVYVELAPGVNVINVWNNNIKNDWFYFAFSSRLGFRYWF